jgi:hypothetical protein
MHVRVERERARPRVQDERRADRRAQAALAELEQDASRDAEERVVDDAR